MIVMIVMIVTLLLGIFTRMQENKRESPCDCLCAVQSLEQLWKKSLQTLKGMYVIINYVSIDACRIAFNKSPRSELLCVKSIKLAVISLITLILQGTV